MKEYVAKRSRVSVSANDIIAIAALAKADKAKGNKVINASIGAYLDDHKKLGSVELIEKALKDHITDDLSYPTVYGSQDYLDGVFRWTFRNYTETIEKNYFVFKGATLGGTGAVSIAFRLFLDQGEDVLLPDIMWSNYTLIARLANIGYKTYTMFDEKGGLNLASLEKTIDEAFEKSNRVLLVINDPCQNPTGYCMTEQEYDALFELLEKESRKGYLTVLFDIAYLSIYEIDGRECALMRKLASKKASFLPIIAFSCSKIFGLYGLRCGALFALCGDEKNQDAVKHAFGSQARGDYSTPVGPALVAISHVFDNDQEKKELQAQIEYNSKVMEERGQFFAKKLKEKGINFYPYVSGFFLTLIVENAFKIYETLKEKHMYIVPLDDNHIRLALSGMTIDEGEILINELKEAM